MTTDLGEEVAMQIEQQGVASFKVDDGEVFIFTKETLEKLVVAAEKEGKVVLFVKTRATA